MRHLVVKVSGTEHNENIKVATADELQYVVLADDLLFYAFAQIVVDEFRGDSFYRFFARWVYFRENDLVELAQAVGKVTVEIACASVEVRLEDGCDLPVSVKLADASSALVDFLRVVSVVGEEDDAVGLQLEVKAAIHSAIGLQPVSKFFCRASVELGHCHGCYAVLDVNGNGLSEAYVADILNRRDEVERNFSVCYFHVAGVEIALVAAVFHHEHRLYS